MTTTNDERVPGDDWLSEAMNAPLVEPLPTYEDARNFAWAHGYSIAEAYEYLLRQHERAARSGRKVEG